MRNIFKNEMSPKLKFIYEKTVIRENGEVHVTKVEKNGYAAKKEMKKHKTEIRAMLRNFFNHSN